MKTIKCVEISRGVDHHTKEKLRIILGNMFSDVKFGFSAYGGHDVDLIYWMTAEHCSGKKMSKSLIADISLAAQAITATVKSYG